MAGQEENRSLRSEDDHRPTKLSNNGGEISTSILPIKSSQQKRKKRLEDVSSKFNARRSASSQINRSAATIIYYNENKNSEGEEEDSRSSGTRDLDHLSEDTNEDYEEDFNGGGGNGSNDGHDDADMPLDMTTTNRRRSLSPELSLRKETSSPQSISPRSPPFSGTQQRPSVITCAPARGAHQSGDESRRGRESRNDSRFGRRREIISGGMCDPVIDEHFRRSLGKNYSEYFPSSPSTSCHPDTISVSGLTVDDHFAKALGETWLRLQQQKPAIKTTTNSTAAEKLELCPTLPSSTIKSIVSVTPPTTPLTTPPNSPPPAIVSIQHGVVST